MTDEMLRHFQQLYASMDTDALVDLQRKGTLRPEAEEVLNTVLEMRGVTTAQRRAIVTELETRSYEDQFKHYAPIGSRIMARIIDTAICFGIAVAVGFAVLKLPAAAYSPAWLLLVPVSFFGYFLFADCMTNGQSFGKKWNGIAVVDKHTHAQCTGIQSLVRNLFLPALGIIDLARVLGHQGHIGDRLAGTQVVKAECLAKLPS
jgi:uncharacterized RDD family membrane protein YckC